MFGLVLHRNYIGVVYLYCKVWENEYYLGNSHGSSIFIVVEAPDVDQVGE